MKPRSAFAKFEQSLAAERKTATAAEIEAGIVEAPLVKRGGPGRPKGGRNRPKEPREAKPDKKGRVSISFPVEPKVLALAAIVAQRGGITTSDVFEKWFEEMAETGKAPTIEPGLLVGVNLVLAIGSPALPFSVFADLQVAAAKQGITPEQAARLAIRDGLKRAEETGSLLS